MCLFHKWEEVKKGIIIQEEINLFQRSTKSRVNCVIEKCSKCNKKRAYVLSQRDDKRKISLWAAENVLKDLTKKE